MNHTLVTGATGTVGRRLVHLLRDRDVPVTALVRDHDHAARLLGPGVRFAVGDFGDPDSLRAAMRGVDRVFLACGNHPHQVAWETALVDAAAAAGVGYLVKLSAWGARPGSPVEFFDAHARIAAHLEASDIVHAVLEPAFSTANLLAASDGVRQAGGLFLPGDGARVAMIDPDDVAAAAAALLTAPGPVTGTFRLTGPRAVTFVEVAAELSERLGHPVRFVPVPDAAALEQLIGVGASEWFAANVVTQFGLLRTGSQDATTDTVQALTGARPASVGEFLTKHAGVFGDVPVRTDA